MEQNTQTGELAVYDYGAVYFFWYFCGAGGGALANTRAVAFFYFDLRSVFVFSFSGGLEGGIMD